MLCLLYFHGCWICILGRLGLQTRLPPPSTCHRLYSPINPLYFKLCLSIHFSRIRLTHLLVLGCIFFLSHGFSKDEVFKRLSLEVSVLTSYLHGGGQVLYARLLTPAAGVAAPHMLTMWVFSFVFISGTLGFPCILSYPSSIFIFIICHLECPDIYIRSVFRVYNPQYVH